MFFSSLKCKLVGPIRCPWEMWKKEVRQGPSSGCCGWCWTSPVIIALGIQALHLRVLRDSCGGRGRPLVAQWQLSSVPSNSTGPAGDLLILPLLTMAEVAACLVGHPDNVVLRVTLGTLVWKQYFKAFLFFCKKLLVCVKSLSA